MSWYVQWIGPPTYDKAGEVPCGEDASGDHDTWQYQRVYLPANQVQAILRLLVCIWPLEVCRNIARARGERLFQRCSAEDEYHVSLIVMLTT